MANVVIKDPQGNVVKRVPVPEGATEQDIDLLKRNAYEDFMSEAQMAQEASEVAAPAGPIAGATQLPGQVVEAAPGAAAAAGDILTEVAKEEGAAGLASSVAPMLVPGGYLVKGTAAGTAGVIGRIATSYVRRGEFPTAGALAEEFAYGFIPESVFKAFGPNEAGRLLEGLGEGTAKQFGKKVILEEARDLSGLALKAELPEIRRAIKADVDRAFEKPRTLADRLKLRAQPADVAALNRRGAGVLAEIDALDPGAARRLRPLLEDFVQKASAGESFSYRELSDLRLALAEELPEFGRKRSTEKMEIGRFVGDLKEAMLNMAQGTPVEKHQIAADRLMQDVIAPQRVAIKQLSRDTVTPDAVATWVMANPNRLKTIMARSSPETMEKIRAAAYMNIFEKGMQRPAGIFDPEAAYAAFKGLDGVVQEKLLGGRKDFKRLMSSLQKSAHARGLTAKVGTAMAQGGVMAVSGAYIYSQGGEATPATIVAGLAGSYAGIHMLARMMANPQARILLQRGILGGARKRQGMRPLIQAFSRIGVQYVEGVPGTGAVPAEQVGPDILS